MGSDHFPIVISFNSLSTLGFFPIKQFHLSKVQWDVFNNNLDGLSHSFPTDFSSLDYAYDQFINCICQAIVSSGAKHFPPSDNRFIPRKSFRDSLWWNSYCSELVSERRNLLQEFKSNSIIENLTAFRKSNKNSNKEIKKIKRENFHSFVNSMNPNHSLIDNFNIIKNF